MTELGNVQTRSLAREDLSPLSDAACTAEICAWSRKLDAVESSESIFVMFVLSANDGDVTAGTNPALMWPP